MRRDVQKIGFRSLQRRDLGAERDAIEAGGQARGVLTEAGELLVAEDRGQAVGPDDHRAPSLLQLERNHDARADAARVTSVLVREELSARRELPRVGGGHSLAGQDVAARVDDERRLATDEPLRPTERLVGERHAVGAVKEQIVKRAAELFLLGLAPDAAEPNRRK